MRSAHGSPTEHGQDRVRDLAYRARLKHSRDQQRNDRYRRGRRRCSAWRERPHPWPQGWQAKRPFRVVAHATVLLLAPAPAVPHRAGGTERRPRTTRSQPAQRSAVAGCSGPGVNRTTRSGLSSMRPNPGGTPRARVLFPLRVPPLEALSEQRPLSAYTAVAKKI